MNSWIIVADSTRARVFAHNKQHTQLEEITDLVHPAGRQREVDQQTDRPGRSFDSVGANRHAMEPHTEWKHKESEKFARQVSTYLTEHIRHFEDLTIICLPEFLGGLRSHLDEAVSNKVIREISKNMIHQDREAIRTAVDNARWAAE
ncbi:MAG: host attachment protein [Gammaproteobacteria bacterium]